MLKKWILPSACLALQAANPWGDAQAAFIKELQPGATGCLVYLERLDLHSVRIRVQAKGTRFRVVEGEPAGVASHSFKVNTPRGGESVWFVTQVPEGAQALRLRMFGEDFCPEVLLALPKVGGVEASVLQAQLPPGHGPASKN